MSHVAFEDIKQLRVPHGFQRIAIAVGHHGFGLLKPALFHHEQGAAVDAVVEQVPWSANADGQRIPRAARMSGPSTGVYRFQAGLLLPECTVGLAGAPADLEGPDDAVRIGPIDLGMVHGVALGQFGEEGSQPLHFMQCIELGPDLRVGRNVVQSIVDGLHVQAASARHDRDGAQTPFLSVLEMAGEPIDRLGFEATTAVLLRDGEEVDEVMGGSLPFFCGGLGGADGDFPIELAAVRGQDVRVECLGNADGEAGLADGGRPDHRDEERGIRAPGWGGQGAQYPRSSRSSRDVKLGPESSSSSSPAR